MLPILRLVLISIAVLGNTVYCDDLPLFPTMLKTEFIEIVRCWSGIQDNDVCPRHQGCMHLLPLSAASAFLKCKEIYIDQGSDFCEGGQYEFTSLKIPSQVYDCVAKDVFGKVTNEDNLQLHEFAKCFRQFHSEKKHKCLFN